MPSKGTCTNEALTVTANSESQVKVRDITEEASIKANDFIQDRNVLAELLNKHYITTLQN